jgi:carbohydrate diacid regulator
VVYIVEVEKGKDAGVGEMLKNIFSPASGDFVTSVDEHNYVVIKELGERDDYGKIEEIANEVYDMLNTEVMVKGRVSFGTIVHVLKDVSKSYKEARMALDVGKIFYAERGVVAYNSLGIGRLIYQLPIPLCKMYIEEIFGTKSPDDFDEETLTTIQKFFENNLNVSETSRQLFIHRNTLVYRLDKLQKSTNLDLRVFEDAITFKIALMVVKYMKFMEARDF